MTRIFIPRDVAALAVGANKVAAKIVAEAQARGQPIEIIRTGSRGMFFLEPLIEVETAQGRIGYGPVSAADVASLFDAGLLDGGAHALRCGYEFFGADKVVFATDTPLGPIKPAIDALKALDITATDRRKIFCGNAEKLLRKSFN